MIEHTNGICNHCGRDYSDPDDTIPDICCEDCPREQMREAAPAMLKALEDLLEYTGGFYLCQSDPDHPIAKAFAAVALAKGDA